MEPYELDVKRRSISYSEKSEVRLKSNLFGALAHNRSIEEAIKSVLEALMDFIGGDTGECWINTPGFKNLTLWESVGSHLNADDESKTQAITTGFIAKIWDEKKPEIINDLSNDERFSRKKFARQKELKTAIGLPLIYNGDCVMVLTFYQSNGEYELDNLPSPQTLSELASHLYERFELQDYLTYFELSGDLHAVMDMQGVFKRINGSFGKILAYDEDQVINRNYEDFLHPDEVKMNKEVALDALRGKPINYFENRCLSKNGEYKWIAWTSYTDKKRQLIYISGKEITQQKELRKALNDHHVIFKKVLENLPVATYFVDQNGHIGYYNKQAENLWGRKPKAKDKWCGSHKFLTRDDQEIHEDDVPMKRLIERRRVSKEEIFKIVRPDGSSKFVKPHPTLLYDSDKKPTGGLNVVVDVTEIIEFDALLRKQTKDLQERVKEIQGLYSTLNILGRSDLTLQEKLSEIVELIPATFQYPDITTSEIIFGSDHFTSDNFSKSKLKLTSHLKLDETAIGKIIVYLNNRNGHGKVSFLEEEKLLLDAISKNIQNTLEQQKNLDILEQLSLIAKKTINPVLIKDRTGKIDWVNDAFEKLTGHQLTEVIGKRPVDFLHGPKTDAEKSDMIRSAIKAGKSFTSEIQKYKKNGDTYWVSIEGQPIRNLNGEITHYFQVETDITENKQLFQQLQKSEASVSKFAQELNRVLENERTHWAREIHDEFGQQLSGIRMSLSTLDKINFEPEKSRDIIQDLLGSLTSATNTLKKLSTELRPGILDSLGLSESIKWLADEFRKKNPISVIKNIKTGEIALNNDSSITFFRICQEALNNVIKHAKASKVEISLELQNNELELHIEDNGVGISSKKINDPFSLGLLGMRERAKLIGATLDITSEENIYTSIKLNLRLNETHQENTDRG